MFGEAPFATLPFSTCLGLYTVAVDEGCDAEDTVGTNLTPPWRPINTNQTPDWELIPTILTNQ